MSIKPCVKLAAKDLQRLVRAEEGAVEMFVQAFRDGKVQSTWSHLGGCVCRTCGYVGEYKSSRKPGRRQMHGGHAVGGRSPAVVLLIWNVYPQCSFCNLTKPGHGAGMPKEFRQFVEATAGDELFQNLLDRKNGKRGFEYVPLTDEELIDLRVGWRERIKEAERTINRRKLKL